MQRGWGARDAGSRQCRVFHGRQKGKEKSPRKEQACVPEIIMPVESTSTKQKLGKGPADMPDRGGSGKPTLLGDSTQSKLGRKEIPVAAFGARQTGGGQMPQTDSASVKLSRSATSPYDKEGMSETTPRTPFQNKRGRR